MALTRLAVFAFILLTACGRAEAPPPEPDPLTGRVLGQGDIIGFVSASGANAWLGLPYAQAPEGDLRWRAPRPPEPFGGPFEALAHPERCPQVTSALDQGAGLAPGQLVGSEDCLRLNVYAPSGAGPDDADRPVMMWIHGGSNVWGYAAQYDGARLAADQDVVVVVIQYRLGPLGFFAHPALMEDADDPGDAAANFALLDMIAALEWVQANIGQFGGDAQNVTVFGESAGGHNVAGLLASPLAEGLFHRAIIQSGSFVSTPLEEARSGSPHAAVEAGARIAGPDADAAALRGAALEAVYAAYDNGGRDALPRMIADGVTIPATGLAAAFDSPETFNAVPVITGTNRDEMKLFNALDDRLTRRRLGVFITPRDPVFYDVLAEYQSRLWRVRAVDEPASGMRAGGHEAVWAYRFDWDDAGSLLFMDLSRVLGAAHGMEIPFVFNHFDFFGRIDPVLFNRRNAQGRNALAGAMGAYWAEFARNGDPGGAGGPGWPVWSEDGVLMRFDAPSGGGPAELINGRDSLERIAEDLRTDERIGESQRCQIANALAVWRPDEGDPVRAALGCA